ncbi:MAG TPA: AAA family ATPase [Ramlibacter sp.]|jgi:PAS domain S-box-containing protein|nr:AAA family ATPase [Ramlibacter sp.]
MNTAIACTSPHDERREVLWEDADRALVRGVRTGPDGRARQVLTLMLTAERPARASVDRLAHEYGLRQLLDGDWAVRPLELVHDQDRPLLVLDDPGGEPLERFLGQPMETGRFLRLALAITATLARLHAQGLVHKDLKPAHLLVAGDGRVRLTGLGLASQLPREKQVPAPPEFIAGTLPYMAPEQTGRMNRSIDSRSDLYALGVVFYRMLTGVLPFSAADPMEWIHCHVARSPVPPQDRVADLPPILGRIVLKLLAKTAEERYQTAAGVEHDLQCCLADWEASRCIAAMPLGSRDLPDRLLIPEVLCGRSAELSVLLQAFENVFASGRPTLVLVAGYSGTGKSSLVHELHKSMVPARGLFAWGKFDQYKREIPYGTLAEALQGLVEQLLSREEAQLRHWQHALREALGAQGQLLVDLIPQLELVIGKQPPAPRLPAQDAHRAFQAVVQRFLAVFATADHPLVLFLDDLQWLDAATLELVQEILANGQRGHLLLVGSYRDNEVGPLHPLRRKIEAVRAAGAPVHEIVLAPLQGEDLAQMVAGALRCGLQRARPLARLVHEKTGGNPLFAAQFLHALVDEGLLAFDHGRGRWRWDLARMASKRYTDNVVDLMVVKLNRLPPSTLAVLQQLACVGHAAPCELLAKVCEAPVHQVHAQLWDAVHAGLVQRTGDTYVFQHDRVREAAYSLIPPEARPMHDLRVARLLLAHSSPQERGELVFDIVNHFNRSVQLITDQAERVLVAALNLEAAERAKSSTAYAAAWLYAEAGAALLDEGCWSSQHALAFRLELQRAECAFLSDAMAKAEERLAVLPSRALDTVERSRVACLQIDMYTTFDRGDEAIAAGLDFLRELGMHWPAHPEDPEVRMEYELTRAALDRRGHEELLAQPLMTDGDAVATLDVLSKLTVPAFFINVPLFALLVCRTVRLILRSGNSDASPAAYVRLGIIAGRLFGDYQGAYRLGQLGRELVDKRGLARFRPAVYFLLGNMVMPWTRHYKAGRDLIDSAFASARDSGYLYYATICAKGMSTNRFAAGDPLALIQREAEEGVAFGRSVKFESFTDLLRANVALARMLRGLSPRFGSLNDADFDEDDIERRYAGRSGMVQFMYWTTKLKARYFAGDHDGVLRAEARLQLYLPDNLSTMEPVDYRFYGALAHAACCAGAAAAARATHLEAAEAHHCQLLEWARHCPDNFACCAALVGAEIARLSQREFQAVQLYADALRAARASGFVHLEALGHELAAGFYTSQGCTDEAAMHLLKARNGYLRWGADGKVRQLQQLHPRLREEHPPALSTAGTIGTPVADLDLATVLEVSRTVSGEIVLDRLLATLLRTALQQAGAQRGFLVVPGEPHPLIEAQARVDGETVAVQLCQLPVEDAALATSVLLYVLRTGELVLLDDAIAHPLFATDPYVRTHRVRSIFCLPLVARGKLSAVLYLENQLAPGVFMSGRTGVLTLLATQAAIALENARLYRDVAEREARIRRLVDANIIGTYIWKISPYDAAKVPVLVEANDAFLRMVGYDRADLAAGRVRRDTLSPPDWGERDVQTAAQVQAAGSVAPFEKEYARKDGSRVPVLMGLAAFDERRLEGLAFVIDLSETKRAEAAAREGERRYREVETALAHATRVATLGQLTASIAHEVSQPVVGVITNAETALRRLKAEPPNVPGAAQALERIVRDGTRARDVIDRIRALVRKAPARSDQVEINGAVCEVLELTKGEAAKRNVLVRTELAEGLPAVAGDRVQLQQVILNLIVNAMDAMAAPQDAVRELCISTDRSGSDSVVVRVRDSGAGIAPAQVARVFDPFYSTKDDGLGIGLSICRSIVHAHGGKLWASPAQPRGMLFQFTLPVAGPAPDHF